MEAINETIANQLGKGPGAEQYRKLMQTVLADSEVQAFLNDHQEELDAAGIQRGAAKLYEYVHERELVAAGKASVAPGYVPRLAVSAGQIDVAYVPTSQLQEARARAARDRRITTVSMPKFIRQATFDNFYTEGSAASESRNEALARAVMFAKNYSPTATAFQPGLYLTGSFGVGKTYLLGALANYLADHGHPTTLVHFPSFAVKMKSSIGKNTTDQERDKIKQVPILMLDDIGADALSAWIRDEVLGVILEYRMQEELPTFFSSTFTMDQLTAHLAVDSQGNEEPLKAQRIMERIRFLSREVVVSGENLRHRQ